MPELPEVETIKLFLGRFLKGHRIISVDVNYKKTFQGDKEKIIGGKVIGTRRFGKVTVIDLDNGYSILAHVKLTGQFIYRGPNLPRPHDLSEKVKGGIPGKHTHVVFTLDHGGRLYFNDVRKFGWIRVEKTSDVENVAYIKKLGPEPFGKVSGKPYLLTLEIFEKILSASSRPVKIVLMDQTKIGGVGNIYANDALWLAQINPKTSANKINGEKAKVLYDSILKVLKQGIRYGGASELTFVTPDGTEGKYQNHTLAYGHDGVPCERCHKALIKKIFLGGRGTYFCPICQK
jgi:formamidopyrimidine-DNA glycosylase